MSHVIYQQILGLIDSSNESTVDLCMLEHSSMACRLLYGLATRLSNLGIGTFYRVVHFFYIGGILSLPYQFYHHGLTNAYRPENFFSENLSDTDLPVKCNLTGVITLEPP